MPDPGRKRYGWRWEVSDVKQLKAWPIGISAERKLKKAVRLKPVDIDFREEGAWMGFVFARVEAGMNSSRLRDICAQYLLAYPSMVGGFNFDEDGDLRRVIVEIDESALTKAKYN
eukprot:maker-scaffold537_size144400-snap-gene-0.24 protein:Tk08655 transcript:maker-scaffold537_size144400-snap-gene-0.24-mRNA-1 annotation:"hypothetical protein H311_01605"